MNYKNEASSALVDVAARIKELREIEGFSHEEMSAKTGLDVETYRSYETGTEDLPFSFLHKCALLFGVEITDLLEGMSANLSQYTVVRKGKGRVTAREPDIEIADLAPRFKDKIAEPYWVTYTYDDEQQNKPIALASHDGQEFDIVMSGKLKVQIGKHTEVLSEGDSIYYNSTVPHGMIAVDGRDCVFCAVVMPGEPVLQEVEAPIAPVKTAKPLIFENFIAPVEAEDGSLVSISFKNDNEFNFAFDVVDAIAEKNPDKLAMLHISREGAERRFTFEDMSKQSARAANYFRSLGIKKGDRVMLVLKRNYQFWVSILALHKLGAVAIPATDQLLEKDFVYRFDAAGVSAIVCTGESNAPEAAELAMEKCPQVAVKIMANGTREGWHDFDAELSMFRSAFPRTEDAPCGADPMLMFFTSGTTGYPKIALHTYKYPLGHFITAKYWHCVDPDGIHFTISDTGWGKALWGKMYGQWLCEAAVFTYDFERFNAEDILTKIQNYKITTFCAPPTMYRFFIKEDLKRFDLSALTYATIAGEALNPEVYNQFYELTGLKLMEGFGQTETTLCIANLTGQEPKPGSMGRPTPQYDIDIVDDDLNSVKVGEVGEIVLRTDKSVPCGMFSTYYRDEEKTKAAWNRDVYHTGDMAWKDEDGYYWYVGRTDDLIKSSGYRIGPFEIESVLMEHKSVLECAVTAVPDELRGQAVKATIVLIKGVNATDELKKELQEHVKNLTAPYKYPRIIDFVDELPKTISGKIRRVEIRAKD